MSKQTFVTIICALALAVVSCGRPLKTATTQPQPVPMKFSKDALVSRGFSFDDRRRPVCDISGPEGPCHVEAFVFGEKRVDETAYTCAKLNKATYIGHCIDDKLEGLSLVIADGTAKSSREVFISYFYQGRIAYPALTSYMAGTKNFGVQEEGSGYGCVYFGKWDKSAERCSRFTEMYGLDIFTESNAQKLRNGTFDLDHYRAKFLEFMQRN